MADYYPLIARAISGLDASAPGESRRALYGRGRQALIAQLRRVQPPLTESEITRERLSLEEAIRKMESEAVQRAREVARQRSVYNGPNLNDAFRVGSRPGASADPLDELENWSVASRASIVILHWRSYKRNSTLCRSLVNAQGPIPPSRLWLFRQSLRSPIKMESEPLRFVCRGKDH